MECPKAATLSGSQVDEVKKLEGKLGVILVAYDRGPSYKKLSADSLSKIQSLEKDTGAILVAYES
ncbi:MAG TPA: hypothetical protein PLM29_09205 [Deltaproteobacteria bacterium]|jgi:hypothetical protein|nr:hypothetical protein [Methanoregulaceae archaeon]HOO46393.1 hypothetical protein [Deltaproteobacteria bacterium]